MGTEILSTPGFREFCSNAVSKTGEGLASAWEWTKEAAVWCGHKVVDLTKAFAAWVTDTAVPWTTDTAFPWVRDEAYPAVRDTTVKVATKSWDFIKTDAGIGTFGLGAAAIGATATVGSISARGPMGTGRKVIAVIGGATTIAGTAVASIFFYRAATA